MNALIRDKFLAELKPSGDVWLTTRGMNCIIIIPESNRKELAQLLWPNVESDEEEWMPDYNPSQAKVDYNHHPWEPE